MNLYFTLFLSVLFILFPISVYSDGTEFGSCCYDRESLDIVVGDNRDNDGKYFCSSGTEFLGEAISLSCSHFIPLYVKDSQGICYGFDQTNRDYYTLEGEAIFAPVTGSNVEQQNSITLIRNILENEKNFPFAPTGALLWFTDSQCISPLTPNANIPTPGPGPGPNPGDVLPEDPGIILNKYNLSDYNVTLSPPFIPGDAFIPISRYPNPIVTNIFTKNVGVCDLDFSDLNQNINRFFNVKSTCESIYEQGNPTCFYNPSRIGNIFGKISLGNTYTSDLENNACQPLAEVASCGQYLSEEVCIANPSLDPNNNYSSFHPNIANGCNWVSAQETKSFSSAQGVCVSNYIEPVTNSGFSELEYSQRLNIIKNPSFEESTLYWSGISKSNLNQSSYFGSNAIKLSQNQILTQEIVGVSLHNYAFSLAVLPTDISNISTVEIKAKVTLRDTNNNQINVQNLILKGGKIYPQSNKNLSIPIYKRVFFESFPTTLDTHLVLLEIQNTGSQEVIIDAINLEEISGKDISNYKPINQIPSSASSCSQCYVEGSYNTCTEDKSNSLGACEYMVEESSTFYGENFLPDAFGKNNQYTTGTISKWESQSLSKSQVFCELYSNENQCTSKSNAIHSTFGVNICSWSPENGCFKNTLNQNLSIPDHREISQMLDKTLSWKQSCDLFSPEVYLEVFGKNPQGDFQSYDYETPLGQMYLHYQLSDHTPLFEACRNYNIESRIYLNYDIEYTNNQGEVISLNRTFPIGSSINSLNSIFETKPLEYFIVSNPQDSGISLPVTTITREYSVLNNNINSLSLRFIDQSGNVGEEFDFGKVLFDTSGPEITLDSHNNTLEKNAQSTYYLTSPEIYPINSIFEFTVSDTSNDVSYCKFRVTGGKNSLYDSSWFEVENFTSGPSSTFMIDLQRVITQTLPFGDNFGLQVGCYDSFNQLTINNYNNLKVLFNNDFSSLYPEEFPATYTNLSGVDINSIDNGFINSFNQEFYFYTNNDGTSCDISLNGANFNTFGSANILENKFIPNLNKNYTYIVSGNILFDSEEENTLTLSCSSQKGDFTRDFTYIVDITKPQLIDFNIDNSTASFYTNEDGVQYIVLDSQEKYVYRSNNIFDVNPNLRAIDFIVTLNGTNSWIKNNYKLQTFIINDSGFNANKNKTEFPFEEPLLYNKNISNYDVFSGDFVFSLQEYKNSIEIPLISRNFKKIEKNLIELSLNMSYIDKAENELEVIHVVLIDNSTPKIKLGGDIGNTVENEKLIFSNSKDPNIIVSFDNPLYRTHTCEVSLSIGNTKFIPYSLGSGESRASFEFNLKDITQTNLLDISSSVHKISMNCVDIFDKVISFNEYSFVFDDSAPNISDVSFSNGNSFARYLLSSTAKLKEVEDVLSISLSNLEQYDVTCSIDFIAETSNYQCNNNNIGDIKFSGANSNTQVSLFSENSKIVTGGNNVSICSTTQNFWNVIPFRNKQDISLEVTCSDFAGNTGFFSTTLDVTHYNTILADVNFNYDQEKAFPKILLTNEIPAGKEIQFYEIYEGKRINILNSTLPKILANTPYRFDRTFIDLTTLSNPDGLISIVATLDLEEITVSLYKDTKSPSTTLSINGEDEGVVLSKNTDVLFSANDESSEIDRVDLILINQESNTLTQLYSSKGGIIDTSIENQTWVGTISSGITLPLSCLDDGSYYLSLIVNDTRGFISVITKDFNVSAKPLIIEGISYNSTCSKADGIILEDSGTTKAHSSNMYWMTKEENANLFFSTNIDSTRCVASQDDFDIISISQNEYQVTLNPQKSFKDNILMPIDIACFYGSNVTSQRKYIYKYDLLPDFVVTSNDGFIVTEQTEIKEFIITSILPENVNNLKCSYDFNSDGFISTPNGENDVHKFLVNISEINDGTYSLDIICEDIFGDSHESKYNLVIEKEVDFEINSVLLTDEYNSKYLLGENEKKLLVNMSYAIEIKTNKPSIQCNYHILEAGIFNQIINFFANIFGSTYTTLSVDSPYESRSYNPFILEEEREYELSVVCDHNEYGVVEKNFDLITVSQENTFEEIKITYASN